MPTQLSGSSWFLETTLSPGSVYSVLENRSILCFLISSQSLSTNSATVEVADDTDHSTLFAQLDRRRFPGDAPLRHAHFA